MKQDEVRQHLRGLVQEFGPKLAKAVLGRRDFDVQHELAMRIDAAMDLLARFEEEAKASPGTDGLVILKALESKLADERAKAPEESRGPSIWELLQKPAL